MPDTGVPGDKGSLEFGLPSAAVQAIRSVLGQCPHVTQATVYGSRAKGNYRPGSDLDLTLDGPQLTQVDLLRVDAALDELMLPWKMDVSLHAHINNPELLAHIARVGKTLWVRNPDKPTPTC